MIAFMPGRLGAVSTIPDLSVPGRFLGSAVQVTDRQAAWRRFTRARGLPWRRGGHLRSGVHHRPGRGQAGHGGDQAGQLQLVEDLDHVRPGVGQRTPARPVRCQNSHEGLTSGFTLSADAHRPRLAAHDPAVWLAGAARPKRRCKGRGDPGAPAPGRRLAPAGRRPEARTGPAAPRSPRPGGCCRHSFACTGS